MNNDLISRRAALDVIDAVFPVDPMKTEYAQGIACGAALAKTYVEQLPSEQPERKMGKWIYNSPMTMKCDQCGFVIKDWDWHRFKFCPNCSADMRGEQE